MSLCAGLGDCVNLCVCVYLRVRECFLVFVFAIDETNKKKCRKQGKTTKNKVKEKKQKSNREKG